MLSKSIPPSSSVQKATTIHGRAWLATVGYVRPWRVMAGHYQDIAGHGSIAPQGGVKNMLWDNFGSCGSWCLQEAILWGTLRTQKVVPHLGVDEKLQNCHKIAWEASKLNMT